MNTPFAFKGDLTLSLHVSDMSASIGWYEEMLGLHLVYKLEEMGWCEMKSPVANVTVGLGQVEEVRKGGGCVPVWGVEDIEKARAYLESKGVKFDGDTITIPEMVRLATFFDPDGNAWMLVQSIGPQAQ